MRNGGQGGGRWGRDRRGGRRGRIAARPIAFRDSETEPRHSEGQWTAGQVNPPPPLSIPPPFEDRDESNRIEWNGMEWNGTESDRGIRAQTVLAAAAFVVLTIVECGTGVNFDEHGSLETH